MRSLYVYRYAYTIALKVWARWVPAFRDSWDPSVRGLGPESAWGPSARSPTHPDIPPLKWNAGESRRDLNEWRQVQAMFVQLRYVPFKIYRIGWGRGRGRGRERPLLCTSHTYTRLTRRVFTPGKSRNKVPEIFILSFKISLLLRKTTTT